MHCGGLLCFAHCIAERPERDEQELVPLCVGEYESLMDAFTLQGGASMRVKHIRSYSVAELQDLVQKKGGIWELVPAWLDANDLRSLLRDYQDPAAVKKPKVLINVPHDVDERAGLLLKLVREIQGTPEKRKKQSEKISAAWPLLDRMKAKADIEAAAGNNLARFVARDSEKRDWKVVVVTAASGSGKTRLMREAFEWVSTSIKDKVGEVYNVSMTFVNGYQLESADVFDQNDLRLSGSIAIGLRLAARLFPLLKVCEAMSLDSFRRGIGGSLQLCDLRTVMRAVSMVKANDKPRWVTLVMDGEISCFIVHDLMRSPRLR